MGVDADALGRVMIHRDEHRSLTLIHADDQKDPELTETNSR